MAAMSTIKQNFRSPPGPLKDQGFGLTETLVAVVAGALLITATAIGVRTISTAIHRNEDLTSMRSASGNGLRLLRSEVQRSLYLIVKGGTHDLDRDYTNIADVNHPEYKAALDQCNVLKGESVFTPVFGIKMAELNTPVIYGLGLSKNGQSFALLRCGAALNLDGRYETEDILMSSILENIASLPCTDPKGVCSPPKDPQGNELSLAQIVQNLDTTLTADNRSPLATYRQPAFAIQTDPLRKLLKIVDPTASTDSINYSFVMMPQSGNNPPAVDLNFIAYARADKVARTDAYYQAMQGDTTANSNDSPLAGCSGANCSFYGIPVTTNSLQFILDGSGSMSACIVWGSTYGTSRTYYNGSNYSATRKSCLLTRMESLQTEMRNILTSLPASTKISIQAFSSPGYLNHRNWNSGNLMELTDLNRASAITFVNSLSSGDVTRWGGTKPWDSLDKAVLDPESKAIYFMTDGDPNNDRNGGSWTTGDFQPTATYYLGKNNARTVKLAINTISVGQDSPWLQLISSGSTGTYKKVDQAYVAN